MNQEPSLTFCVDHFDDSIEGSFVPSEPDKWAVLDERFDNALDSLEAGRVNEQGFVSECKAILKLEPYFLDAYAHLGNHGHANGKSSAYSWYKKGYELGLKLVPSNFEGTISWGILENRPFLRCHHGYLLGLIERKKFEDVIFQMQRHLTWNPNDNIGIRYLLGDAYLAAGKLEEARPILEEMSAEYPPSCYSLGLLELVQRRFVQAATALRKGFLGNPYVAEALLGRAILHPHAFWHGTSDMAPETAMAYVSGLGADLWLPDENALTFLDWLFNCSDVLRERAELLAFREQLLYEHDVARRGDIIEAESKFLDAFGDNLSVKLIRTVTDRDGQRQWPWEVKGWHEMSF